MSNITNNQQRIALSAYFFLSGLAFASWASRIPTIKDMFNLNEAQLGTILLTMPICSLIGIPISGWLVAKYDSRQPLIVGFIAFAIILFFIGFVSNTTQLVIALSLFAFFMRILNVSGNTQSITLQQRFEKRIIGSLHGLWSIGGVTGVGFSTLMVYMNVSMKIHLMIVAAFTLITAIIAYRYTLKKDKSTTGNKIILGKPDPFIVLLGLLVFFAAICEGGMFDWSGVYFKEVVGEKVFTYGYFTFMGFMALSRFFSDKIIDSIGMPRMYIYSALLVALGIFTAIQFPTFWPALLGFCLIGIGTAAVFPMTFALAGTSKKYSPGIAVSIITTYGTLGFLLGPPFIGYLAHAIGLQNAFYTFLIAGLMLIPISQLFFKNQQKQKNE
ncbi:MFS transporter [Urechidicola croceus]|uniref:MFS transporter n=1 Tax=Urechidicola croceus TaxID=1850246 RepID=A0A1D8P501_9FLAO|nr:MFS transporter [Urechidicola croceus]AOW19591.1 MFS transporter [Urechidicola croceus]